MRIINVDKTVVGILVASIMKH